MSTTRHSVYTTLQELVLNLPKERQNMLPLPPLLESLMQTDRWKQPSDNSLTAIIPFLRAPVDFLLDEWQIRFESQGQLSESEEMSQLFHEYRSIKGESYDLPWLDIGQSLMIAVNRFPGDDVGIALDYRPSSNDPRVVASDWWTGDKTHHWREVFPTFSTFIKALELYSQQVI